MRRGTQLYLEYSLPVGYPGAKTWMISGCLAIKIGKNVSFTDINQHWSVVMQEFAI